MCRSIRTLHNVPPPAREEEIAAAARQFARKLCGFARPSRANEAGFERAVTEITATAATLLASLVTQAPPRDREVEAARARAKRAARLATAG